MVEEGSPAPDVPGTDFMFVDALFTLSSYPDDILLFSFVDDNGDCDNVVQCLEELWVFFGRGEHGVQIFAIVHEGTQTQAKGWLEGLGATFHGIHSTVYWERYVLNDPTIDPNAKPHSFIIGLDRFIKKRYVGETQHICDELKCDLLDVKIERDPIDLEMVMDVSGSMNSFIPSESDGMTKLEMMEQAISIVGDYLKTNTRCNDRMGLIWFTDNVREYILSNNQKLFTIHNNWDSELRGQVNNPETGICTAMGAGLQTAFNNLEATTQQGFVILCTDGIQNINPLVVKVVDHYEIREGDDWCGQALQIGNYDNIDIASYGIPVQTIGVGITGNYGSLLQGIATKTGAHYRGTNTPGDDLDEIYLESLCDIMAGGSPSIIYHNISCIIENESEKEEFFYINDTISKITAILTWKKPQGGNFMFWLYSPDGTLLNLHREMKLHENHCMATIYLPKRQNGEALNYTGKWRMVIRGEFPTTPADYHVFIIGEDTNIKLMVDFPEDIFEVGDLLPIKLAILKKKKTFAIKPTEISIEMKFMPIPLSELLAKYDISVGELLQKMKTKTKKIPKNPLILKVNALSTNPKFQKQLIPTSKLFSLQEGNLQCDIKKEEVLIQIALEQPGLHSFKINVLYENPENGIISRTKMFSTIVGPGKADPKQSSVNKLNGKSIKIIPRNKKGQLLGPGYSNEFKLQVGKKESDVDFKDLLDGTYQIELPVKEEELDVDITFHNNLIWRGKL